MLRDALFQLIIMPVFLLIETAFVVLYDLLKDAGASILAVSLVVNLFSLPLYLQADRLQEKERKIYQRLLPGIRHIKKTFRGDEQYMMLSTYYRQNGYSPLHAMRGTLPLLLQVPFFIAAYRFLSGLPLLHGTPYFMIRDLSQPDGLLSFSGMTFHLLPLLMTLLNLLSAAVYTRTAPLKDRLQAYGLAALFLVLLYQSPSGLVLYWTCNQVFSLVKNLVASLLPERRTKKKKETAVPSAALFYAAAAFLALLTGALIPSAVIADSPLEFIDLRRAALPLRHVLSSFFIAAGVFLFWGSVIRAVLGARGRRVLAAVFAALGGVLLVNYFLFGNGGGVLNADLVFDPAPSYTVPQFVLSSLLALCAAAFFYLFAYKKRQAATFALTALSVTVLFMTGWNARTVISKTDDAVPPGADTLYAASDTVTPILHLSPSGKNVVVFMLDRAISGYLPYIMQEKPELARQFDGFVYYPNTLSHGAYTVFGAPALFGGYDYTVAEMNRRNTTLLVDKHNEALKVLPRLFSENGYDVTVCDPPFAGYRWIPDLSIYRDLPGVHAHLTDGVYTATVSAAYDRLHDENRNRNLFCYALFRSAPLPFRPFLLDEGRYHSLYASSAVPATFLNAYAAIANLIPLSDTQGTGDTFLMLQNATPHEPVLLETPSYTPSPNPANAAIDDSRFTLPDGRRMRMDTTWQLSHYHVNMASLMRIGEWLDWMRENGVYDNTRIIIASDHGRFLGQFEGLMVDKELDAQSVNALLMVKDFQSDAPLTTRPDFMTNADVPFLATDGVIRDARNPYTGNPLDGQKKKKEGQLVTTSDNWRTSAHPGNVFDVSDGHWYEVHDDIFKKENWKRVD